MASWVEVAAEQVQASVTGGEFLGAANLGFFFWTFSDFNCSAEATRTFSCLVFIYLNSYCPWPWYFLVVFYVQ